MHLPRHTIESHAAVPLFQHASFCSQDPTAAIANTGADANRLPQPAVFSCASLNGFMVSQTDPLKLVSNRTWSSSQGGLSHAVPVQHTSLLFLVGGGRVPRFAPNKVILWDEAAQYTAKEAANSAHGAGSDDDDELDSAPSRRASTIFSAGSQFDAYGRANSQGFDHVDNAHHGSNRSPSSEDGFRFSTSSLVDAEDQQAIAKGLASSSLRDIDTMDRSVGASSLGIGRLQASHLSEGSDSSDRPPVDPVATDLDSSFHAHSIMSSSANLDDPFAQEQEVRPHQDRFSPRKYLTSSRAPQHQQIDEAMSSASSRSDMPSSSPAGLFSSQSTRQPNAGLVDSVSSLATTVTNTTAKAKPKILHGREIVELEFSEVVRGIYATSIHATRPAQDETARKGKGRASSETTKSPRFCVVLVVVLASKAVVFELSPPSTARNPGGNASKPAWTIRKRTAVQTFQNRKGLGSVAPCSDGSTTGSAQQATAIVAVPGRQKGHVQLLSIRLQSLTALDAGPTLSNSASSVGAASIIVAHESSLAAITLSPDGRLLATASSKGTLVRVWSNNFSGAVSSGSQRDPTAAHGRKLDTPGRTGSGTRLIRELRRGTDTAAILSVAFTPDASMIAAASDKGTIHVFLLADPSPTAENSSGDQGRSSPSTSSRKANLGRAAAQYLPSGLGSLARQIPPSVYPQYLKSEWSSAQFRIPLKSFGASSRHYTAPSAADDAGLYGAGSAPAAPAGTEKSTEGAWAQMRSRISDVRKGEASVDERIFLCWVAEGSVSSVLEPSLLDKGSKAAKDRSRPTQKSNRAPDTPLDLDNSPARYHLIALTTSGGWYKLAVTMFKTEDEDTVSSSTVLDMYRRNTSSRSKQANALECRLVEFRPMAALLDGWRA